MSDSGYCITNEIDAISKALNHFIEFKKEFDKAAIYEYTCKSWYFKIISIFINVKLNDEDLKYFYESDFYIYKFKHKNYNLFRLESAIESLKLWKIAIERGNHFTISEYDYSNFLKYIKFSEK